MGLAVYITHDISDFFLAVGSPSPQWLHILTMRLTDLQNLKLPRPPARRPHFALFILVWVYARHYLNLRILYSILTEFRTVGPFFLNWETGYYKANSRKSSLLH
jgi:acyl-CoA-dependent ceramide synthase